MHNIIAFFAHPDDESFGPGGTLALLSKSHNIHIIFATKGESCTTDKKISRTSLKKTRMKEAKAAATIIGAKTLSFLDFPDGFIGNEHISEMTSILDKEIVNKNATALVTFEPRGFSGHLDHIAVTSAVTSSFHRLKQVRAMYYFGITHQQKSLIPPYFIPIPPGYPSDEFDVIVNVDPVWSVKKEAIQQYRSQKADIDFWNPMLEGYHKHEHFIGTYKNDTRIIENILQAH